MALDYAQSAALMMNTAFRDRIKVACLKYADYIKDEAPSTPAHNTRLKWSQETMISPDTSVARITPIVVMDAQVQEQGDAITDANLQTVVETAINESF